MILEEWLYSSECDSTAIVLPDGCCDVICQQDEQHRFSFSITSLDSCAYEVALSKGVSLRGFRLKPGAVVDEKSLAEFMAHEPEPSKLDSTWLDEFCTVKALVNEALEGLRSDLNGIGAVAKNLGVSVRTLQRHIRSETGKPPYFWMSLVRARRCARLLAGAADLTDAALASGYADQSHMTRELQRWFQCTPLAFKQGHCHNEIRLSGYD